MKFGAVPLAHATDGLLAHRLVCDGKTYRKGHRLNSEDIQRLQDAGIDEVTVARLDPEDEFEDIAARRVAKAMAGEGIIVGDVALGRAFLSTTGDGLLWADDEKLLTIHQTCPGLAVATCPQEALVRQNQKIATIKVIPFALPRARVDAVIEKGAVIRLAPLRTRCVGLLQTTLPITKETLIPRTEAMTRARLTALNNDLLFSQTCPHTYEQIAAAIQTMPAIDLLLLITASATTDEADDAPAGVVAAGGTILRCGMPMDPGNLIVFARYKSCDVLILPGCARSKVYNGYDWALRRYLTGLPVDNASIDRLGVGGLLA
ncbi:MAG: molybdopterin-binding protein [Pseudomonadota bacterium]